jgi:hypothetical protein
LETEPFIASEASQEPFVLAGFTEPPHSASQLESVLRDATQDTQLPFDSIPLQTYHGKHKIPGSGILIDQPTSSRQTSKTELEPSWSRGAGLELSPLKTRSAKKKTLSGSSSVTVINPNQSQGALRDIKALARGNP